MTLEEFMHFIFDASKYPNAIRWPLWEWFDEGNTLDQLTNTDWDKQWFRNLGQAYEEWNAWQEEFAENFQYGFGLGPVTCKLDGCLVGSTNRHATWHRYQKPHTGPVYD